MPNQSYLSIITLPSGSVYYIKDAEARDEIEEIKRAMRGGVKFIGTTTTPLTDGATTSPIVIGGKEVTPESGNLVRYLVDEFLFDDGTWVCLGSIGSLGALAYKDSASGDFTPSGTVSQPTFTGSSSNVNVTV